MLRTLPAMLTNSVYSPICLSPSVITCLIVGVKAHGDRECTLLLSVCTVLVACPLEGCQGAMTMHILPLLICNTSDYFSGCMFPPQGLFCTVLKSMRLCQDAKICQHGSCDCRIKFLSLNIHKVQTGLCSLRIYPKGSQQCCKFNYLQVVLRSERMSYFALEERTSKPSWRSRIS